MEKYTDEQIDKFVNDEMLPSERQDFCRMLEEDSELREKVILRKLAIEAIRSVAEEELRNALLTPVSTTKRRRIVVALVTAAAILVGILFLWGDSYKYSPEELFEEYYSVPSIELPRGGNGLPETDALVNRELKSLFEQKEYKRVVDIYQEKWNSNNVNHYPVPTLLYVCISALETEQTPVALSLLSKLDTSEYKEEANWLLFCTYLKNGNRTEAQKRALSIQRENGNQPDKINEIIQKLKEKKWFGK